MRSLVGVFALGAAWVGLATPTISGLKVSTISPLGLAIDYTVSGAVARDTNRAIKVSMAVGGVTNVAKAIAGETNCVNGAHRVYWNTAEDGISIDQAKSKVSVEYGEVKLPLYMVIDLSGGTTATSYGVSYLDAPPSGGFNTTVYKTKKLVLRRCPAGNDPFGRYTIENDFYAGLFEVTQGQWKLVVGNLPGIYYVSGDTYPVQYVYAQQGEEPKIFNKLRTKTGFSGFGLPTEKQWEYACLAGETNVFLNASALANIGWLSAYSYTRDVQVVGGKPANAWGFYDMIGNVWEYCSEYEDVGDGGSYRLTRGGSVATAFGSLKYPLYLYEVFRRASYYPSDPYHDCGLRLFLTMP